MKKLIMVLLPLWLAGCETHASCPTPPPVQPVPDSVTATHTTSQQLYQNGALNQKAPQSPGMLQANSDRISLDWEGDAVELLSQLARQRGLGFAYDGVRLPVPVSLHVSNITFEALLRNLDMQIGWRAVLKQQPLELHLYFALPDKGGRLA